MAKITVTHFSVNEGAVYVLDDEGIVWRYNTKITPHWENLAQLPQRQTTNIEPALKDTNVAFVVDPPMTTPSDEAVQEVLKS